MNYFLLNNVRSIENVGSLFRIADSLGWGLLLQGFTPHPKVHNDSRLPYVIDNVEKRLHKTGVKTLEYVSWKYFNTDTESLDFITENKLNLYCLEEGVKDSVDIFTVKKVKSSLVLVLGNEISGVDPRYLDECARVFHIPMKGVNTSMNVSVSAALAGFALGR